VREEEDVVDSGWKLSANERQIVCRGCVVCPVVGWETTGKDML